MTLQTDVMSNLQNYAAFCDTFEWREMERHLAGLPDGKGLNIAHESVDRHAVGPLKNTVALRWLRKTGDAEETTYAELQQRIARFANVLGQLGVVKGDTVFPFAGRIPE